MKIKMLYAGKVHQTINENIDRCTNPAIKFKLLKAKAAIENSINVLKPIIDSVSDDANNKWLATVYTFDFDPLTEVELFDNFPSLTIDSARWLLLITTTQDA